MNRLLSLFCCGALLLFLAGCTASLSPKEPGPGAADPTAPLPTAAPGSDLQPADWGEPLIGGVQTALLRILPPTWEELSWDADLLASAEHRAVLAWQMTLSDPRVPHVLTPAFEVSRKAEDYKDRYRRLFGEEGDPALLPALYPGLELRGDALVDCAGDAGRTDHFSVKEYAFTPAGGEEPAALTFTLFTGCTPYADPAGRHYLTGMERDFPANGAEITACLALRPAGADYRVESLILTPVRQPETDFPYPTDPREQAVYANRVLGENLAYALAYLPAIKGDRVADPRCRALFAWGWLEHAHGVPRTYGRSASGDMDVATADYQTVYRMLFGEEGDPALLPAASAYFKIAGDTVQGAHPTGGYPQAAAKFVSFTETEEGVFTLTADVLKSFGEEGYGDGVAALYDPEVTEYPAEAVSYRVMAQLRREDGRYFLVGLYVG